MPGLIKNSSCTFIISSSNIIIINFFLRIEHPKLEFTISLKVRKDPHIQQQYKALQAPTIPSPSPLPSSPHKSRLFGNIFGSTPKKSKVPSGHQRAHTDSLVPFVMKENLARYLTPDGVLGRTFVKFKEIQPYCDTKLMETTFTFFGQRLTAPGEGGGAGLDMVGGERDV